MAVSKSFRDEAEVVVPGVDPGMPADLVPLAGSEASALGPALPGGAVYTDD